MNFIQCAELLESEGFGNAAKFLRNFNINSDSIMDNDADLMSLLTDPNISQGAKIGVLADMVVPNEPEPNLNKGYSEVQNNLHEIAMVQWMARKSIRKEMIGIAASLQEVATTQWINEWANNVKTVDNEA
jgi:replicative superfamily II helicase